MDVEYERQVGIESLCQRHRLMFLQPMDTQCHTDPGVRLSVGSRSNPGAIGLHCLACFPADQEDVRLAESGYACRTQLAIPLWLKIAHIQETATSIRVDLAESLLDPDGRRRLIAEGLAAPVCGRQVRYLGGVYCCIPELPGQPVVESYLPGGFRRVGRHRPRLQAAPLIAEPTHKP